MEHAADRYRDTAVIDARALGVLAAVLALLAAATGFCAGCTAFRIGYRLTGRRFASCPLPVQPGR